MSTEITVRELIEHLAQFDSDLKVKVRDPKIPMIMHPIDQHSVDTVEFIDEKGTTSLVVVVG